MDKKQFWNDLKSGLFSSMVKESSKGQHLFSPKDVFNVMKPIFAEKDDIERIYSIFLDNQNRIIAIEKMFDGTICHAMVYPREIVKRVIDLKSTGVILVHNHVSGNTKPSKDDEKITLKIYHSLLCVDVQLHDHIIIGDTFLSMADNGMIDKYRDRTRELMKL